MKLSKIGIIIHSQVIESLDLYCLRLSCCGDEMQPQSSVLYECIGVLCFHSKAFIMDVTSIPVLCTCSHNGDFCEAQSLINRSLLFHMDLNVKNSIR